MARRDWAFWLLAIWLCMIGKLAFAQQGSLFPGGGGNARALLQDVTPTNASGSSSLFSGTQGQSFFAALPQRTIPRAGQSVATGPAGRLLDLIALAEAGPLGHDAVQYGATVRPSAPPTQMTIGQIYAWIDDTPGQPHAIGRYQFIPITLRRLVTIKGYTPETVFSAEVQDQLAMVLLEEAGLADFAAGSLDRVTFMHNLSKIWAGLPLPNGRSYYQGHAGNAATMTWARFERGMAQIFPLTG